MHAFPPIIAVRIGPGLHRDDDELAKTATELSKCDCPACAGLTWCDLPTCNPRQTRHIPSMRNLISILFGIVALILVIPAFIPFLGWANWIIIPIAIIGLAIGAMSDRTSGRNLNIVVIAVGVGRLLLGGGFV